MQLFRWRFSFSHSVRCVSHWKCFITLERYQCAVVHGKLKNWWNAFVSCPCALRTIWTADTVSKPCRMSQTSKRDLRVFRHYFCVLLFAFVCRTMYANYYFFSPGICARARVDYKDSSVNSSTQNSIKRNECQLCRLEYEFIEFFRSRFATMDIGRKKNNCKPMVLNHGLLAPWRIHDFLYKTMKMQLNFPQDTYAHFMWHPTPNNR